MEVESDRSANEHVNRNSHRQVWNRLVRCAVASDLLLIESSIVNAVVIQSLDYLESEPHEGDPVEGVSDCERPFEPRCHPVEYLLNDNGRKSTTEDECMFFPYWMDRYRTTIELFVFELMHGCRACC